MPLLAVATASVWLPKVGAGVTTVVRSSLFITTTASPLTLGTHKLTHIFYGGIWVMKVLLDWKKQYRMLTESNVEYIDCLFYSYYYPAYIYLRYESRVFLGIIFFSSKCYSILGQLHNYDSMACIFFLFPKRINRRFCSTNCSGWS